jgi:hypothetical protein
MRGFTPPAHLPRADHRRTQAGASLRGKSRRKRDPIDGGGRPFTKAHPNQPKRSRAIRLSRKILTMTKGWIRVKVKPREMNALRKGGYVPTAERAIVGPLKGARRDAG